MEYYCVVSEFYDNGRVSAWITCHIGDKLPINRSEEHSGKDVYFDYFKNKSEAVEFYNSARKA
ncbi:hypothetical protein M2151_001170 [Lachnospiraceae bacterium PH1-22]